MSQIDVLLQYATKGAALSDPALAAFVVKDPSGNPAGFDQSAVFDQQGRGLSVWQLPASYDAAVSYARGALVTANGAVFASLADNNLGNPPTIPAPGSSATYWSVSEPAYQPGYTLIVSYEDPTIAPGSVQPDAPSLASWKANAACLLIADRDAANAGNGGFLYYAAAAIAASLAQWFVQPTPLGASYRFGTAPA